MYAVYIAALGGLRFPLTGDELHFWPTAVDYFGQSPLPSVEALRAYPELNTPLPFIVWGELEYWLHQGVWLPRAINLLLSFGIAALIARRSALAAAVLLLCPYFLFVSGRIYTDIMAIFFAVFGLWAYLERRFAWSAVLFVLAISSRQPTVAFPLAIVACEITRPPRERSKSALAAASVAMASPVALTGQLVATAPAARVLPQNGLYLLSCLGFYVALPLVLIDREARAAIAFRRCILAAGVILAVLFAIFPPLHNAGLPAARLGLLDRLLHATALPPVLQIGVLWALALTAVTVAWRTPLALALTIASAVVMLKGHAAWDKYALPAVAAWWLIESRRMYDRDSR